MQEKQKFYQKNWFMWALLILLPPIGTITMWLTKKDMKRNRKIILTIASLSWWGLVISQPKSSKQDTSAVDATQTPSPTTSASYLETLEIKEMDTTNGTYAFIEADKDKTKSLSEEDYLSFCENVVKDSGYNWFTISFSDNTGIQFAGCITEVATYGELDSEYCIEESIGMITITDENVEYEENFSTEELSQQLLDCLPSEYTSDKWYLVDAYNSSNGGIDFSLQINVGTDNMEDAISTMFSIHDLVEQLDYQITSYSYALVNDGSSVAVVLWNDGDSEYTIIHDGTSETASF